MATWSLYYNWELPIDGKLVSGGSRSLPTTATISNGVKHDATYSVAAGVVGPPVTNIKVLLNVGSAATDDIAAFTALVIVASLAGWIEVLGTNAADNSVIPIAANIPLFLGPSTNGTMAYNAGGGFAGAQQNITKISYCHTTAGAATVRVVALS